MNWFLYIAIVIATFWFMEFMAWFTHKFVMHGFMWFFHEDHHQKRDRFFEKNDAFFLIYAVPSWLCIMLGIMYQTYWVVCIGAGIAVYGFAYFLIHDVIIHQRFKWFTRSNNRYIRVVRWAHKMHHKHLDKHHGESFGMLIVNKKYWEKVKKDDLRNA